MRFSELEQTVKKYMLLADPGIIKLLCAYVLAIRLPIPPPWLFILGASSGGKSMILNSLAKVKGFISLDDLTAASFLSGMKSYEGDNSLLTSMPKTGAFLVFKDFTTILSKQKEQKAAIIGLLRKIYDGEMDKKTGNMSETMKWEGKIGVLGGSTSSFYTKMGEFADMGERTLAYIFQQPGKRDLGKRIFKDGLKDFEAKDSMRAAFKIYLDGNDFQIPEKTEDFPEFDEQTQEDIIDLAELTTTARSSVERNVFDNNSITATHFEEQIGRFQKEIMAMSLGFMIINKHETGAYELIPEDKKTLYGMALDTIPHNRRKVLVQITKMGGSATIKSLSKAIGLDNTAIKIAIGDMHAHKMITFHSTMSEEVWELHPKWQNIITKFEYMDITPVKQEADEEPPISSYEQDLINQLSI